MVLLHPNLHMAVAMGDHLNLSTELPQVNTAVLLQANMAVLPPVNMVLPLLNSTAALDTVRLSILRTVSRAMADHLLVSSLLDGVSTLVHDTVTRRAGSSAKSKTRRWNDVYDYRLGGWIGNF
jgi:hypothetical protein